MVCVNQSCEPSPREARAWCTCSASERRKERDPNVATFDPIIKLNAKKKYYLEIAQTDVQHPCRMRSADTLSSVKRMVTG